MSACLEKDFYVSLTYPCTINIEDEFDTQRYLFMFICGKEVVLSLTKRSSVSKFHYEFAQKQ